MIKFNIERISHRRNRLISQRLMQRLHVGNSIIIIIRLHLKLEMLSRLPQYQSIKSRKYGQFFRLGLKTMYNIVCI